MARKRSTGTNQRRSDQEVLNLFIEKTRWLAGTSLGQTGFSVNHQITYDQAGITTVLDQPDEEAVRSFLMTFRQFVSENESVFLGRVYGVCNQHLEDDVLKDQIKQAKKIWASVRRGWGTVIVYNNVEYSGQKIFDVWVDGWYFHSDVDKKKLLDQVDPITREWFRVQFISFIIGISRLVQDLCQIILNGFVEDLAKPGFILLPLM